MTQRFLVVAPGRGTYGRKELAWLSSGSFSPRALEILAKADAARLKAGLPTITELDSSEKFRPSLHQSGANSSALIFTLAAMDFVTLEDRLGDQGKIAGVLGNSMGWYSSLFTSGHLSFEDAYSIVETMGQRQKDGLIGGQLIYPVCNDQWQIIDGRIAEVEQQIEELNKQDGIEVYVSIYLGGNLVLAGNNAGLDALKQSLPEIEMGSHKYPFQLAMHSAFHTPLLSPASLDAKAHFAGSPLSWQRGKYPLIDGRGYPWLPYGGSDSVALADYTLGHQVTESYDFSTSVRIALREYNPDQVILLGPGSTLGSSIAQTMISERWRGIKSRDDFMNAQENPNRPLVALGRSEQRDAFFARLSTGV
ncbi:MAG: ACP S-malonyltransferase [Planctomycetota bacterium]|nr:ACP S-malonyltransferase [Planctomycetota bacterium]